MLLRFRQPLHHIYTDIYHNSALRLSTGVPSSVALLHKPLKQCTHLELNAVIFCVSWETSLSECLFRHSFYLCLSFRFFFDCYRSRVLQDWHLSCFPPHFCLRFCRILAQSMFQLTRWPAQVPWWPVNFFLVAHYQQFLGYESRCLVFV